MAGAARRAGRPRGLSARKGARTGGGRAAHGRMEGGTAQMGGLRNGKGFGVCKAYFGVYAGCLVSCVKLWFCSWLRLWRESKGWRFLQALAIASLFVPAVAYAVPGYQSGLAGVIQGPSAWYEYGASVDDPYYGYFCYAYDKYEAAVWSLGLDPTSSSFTAEAKAKLSNESTGGRFYTYADKFRTFGANSEPHAWLSRDFYGQWVTLYGRDFLYWGEVTTAEQDGAKADLQTILNGGNLGGSGGGGSSGGGSAVSENGGTFKFVGNGSAWMGDTHDFVWAGANVYEMFNVWVTANHTRDYSWFITVNVGNGDLNVWRVGGDYELVYEDGKLKGLKNTGNATISFENASSLRTWSNDVYTITYVPNGGFNHPVAPNAVYNLTNVAYVCTDEDSSAPVVPPTNWPESDPVDAPAPPELPEPDNPVIDDEPDSTFPVYIDVSTTNYTADLQGVLDAMDDHCLHLQESIWWGFNNFWNKLYQYITWSVGVMQSEFAATRDYLHDLFDWLAEQFDYSVSGGAYNDSTVVSWLKKIYSTLGLGVNTRPSDPVADPDGIGDWLGQLFANFIAWLAGFGAGLVAGLADDFAELTTKFPFSIPWDIGAMLALVVAEPVAPSFEYPLYTLDASGSLVESGVVEVDLSVFDSYMVGIRFMQKLLFCLMLAWRTADLKELLRIGRSR